MDAKLQFLTNEIREETERILTREPEEIKRLYAGILPHHAGACGQYFGTMVFAVSELRAVSILYMGTGVLRAIKDDQFTLDHCKKLLRYYNLTIGTRFLGYSGFERLWRFTEQIFLNLDEITTKRDLEELLDAFFNYIWILYEWSLQKFPWGLGTGIFQKQSKANLEEIGKMYLQFAGGKCQQGSSN